jgi:formylglycine-generating enzyme required for sulfatase activity
VRDFAEHFLIVSVTEEKRFMRRIILVLWMAMLIPLMSIPVPVSAQDDTCDPGMFGEVDGLLTQAQEALDNGNITTATVILSNIRIMIAPCTGGDSAPLTESLSPVTRNADWTPVIQEFDGVEMVLVPPGCFDMGNATGSDREQLVHQQCFDEPFWIDRYEVTNAQYHRTDAAWAKDTLPLALITWPVAYDFCKLRGTRLPTEAEWEFAARGPDGLLFPWGNDFVPENVVYRGNASQTSEVGSRPGGASWVGALDMSGNVMEWTSTLYREYPYNADDGRELLTNDGSARVVRGGSFYDDEFFVNSAYRIGADASNNNYNLGLRCARSYSGTP